MDPKSWGTGGDNFVGLFHGDGPQTLYGAPGESMVGGKAPDTFVFEPGFGQDTVVNFQTNKDVLQFNPSLLIKQDRAADPKTIGFDRVIGRHERSCDANGNNSFST